MEIEKVGKDVVWLYLYGADAVMPPALDFGVFTATSSQWNGEAGDDCEERVICSLPEGELGAALRRYFRRLRRGADVSSELQRIARARSRRIGPVPAEQRPAAVRRLKGLGSTDPAMGSSRDGI